MDNSQIRIAKRFNKHLTCKLEPGECSADAVAAGDALDPILNPWVESLQKSNLSLSLGTSVVGKLML